MSKRYALLTSAVLVLGLTLFVLTGVGLAAPLSVNWTQAGEAPSVDGVPAVAYLQNNSFRIIYLGTTYNTTSPINPDPHPGSLPVERLRPLLPIIAEAQRVESLTDRETRILENDTLDEINRVREDEDLDLLTRIRDLDPAALLSSHYNATNPDNPLTHAIPYSGLLAVPLELLEGVGITTSITEDDLEAIGMQPGYVARSTTRATLAGHKLGRDENSNYARLGGISEVAARGYNLTAESIVQAFNSSPPHAAAIRGDYKHAGVVAVQGESGITTVCVVLGRGLNTSVDWPISTRGLIYSIYVPIVTTG